MTDGHESCDGSRVCAQHFDLIISKNNFDLPILHNATQNQQTFMKN